jgi:L-asparaginase
MNFPKVLLIYTGGTIGMVTDPNTGSLTAFDFGDVYKHIPELKALKINLETRSFPNPIDSSEMNPNHWKQIAEIIYSNYNSFDGFVVLHGSDTMAFSASALSFMLQGLKKPVIFTGSQLPIGTIRTDGKENLVTAIEIAAAKTELGTSHIQEVAIYFEYHLYRGNRTTKVSASSFEAFCSPNIAPLAEAGVHIHYHSKPYTKKKYTELELFTQFNDSVALIKLFPGLNWSHYAHLFQSKDIKAIILETFGAGNVSSDSLFQKLLTSYVTQGGIVLNVTQCATGIVEQGKYETSGFLNKMGVISGKDLTTEAAICKTMYALGKHPDSLDDQKRCIATSICGEMKESLD